ncbi:MAG TPA: TRAP transporter small permease [Rhabdaerophilum sp.]|nr:TRAP transporter small permease [Rhabdaerophilum sp.]
MAETAEASCAGRRRWLEIITGWIAIGGGVLTLAVSFLVVVSVLGRWLFRVPIDGDFEFVEMATALAVFSYLPLTQARRGHIMVDTFTMRFRQSARDLIDAFWDLVYALMLGFCAFALFFGTANMFGNGQTTMQRQLPIWPSIGLSAILCTIAALVGVVTALSLYRRAKGGAKA